MVEKEIVIPTLQEGNILLADRFHCWSSITYGVWDSHKTYNREVVRSLMIANGLLSKHVQFLIPDITFYLSLSAERSFQRVKKKKKKDIYEQKEAITEILKGYDWLLREFPKEFEVIDADRSIDEITEDMVEKIGNLSHES
jgi:thymidylate kinase